MGDSSVKEKTTMINVLGSDISLVLYTDRLGSFVQIFTPGKCHGFYNGAAPHAGDGFSLATNHKDYPTERARNAAKEVWTMRERFHEVANG